MADKNTNLAITISTVDKATAKIRAINKALDAASKPRADLKKALGEFAEKSGFNGVLEGFKGVGSAIGDLLGKVAMIGGVTGLAVAGLFKLVDSFDDLGKKAARLGVSVDWLASMRYAAEKTGVPVEALDDSLLAFNSSLGQARAGTGRMAKFLGIVSPVLLTQVKAAKDNAAAFDLIAGAMAKVTDPAKRAALAQKVFGDSALAPMFSQGPKALKELRERYMSLAGSQEGAVDGSEKVHDSMVDLHATVTGLEASLVEGLAPALKQIVDELQAWFQENRGRVKEWAEEVGKKLPDAIHMVADTVLNAIDTIGAFISKIGGLKTVVVAVAAIVAGPLIAAFISLGIALAPVVIAFAPVLAAITGIVAAVALAVKAISELVAYGKRVGERAAFRKLTAQHADEIKENNPDLSEEEIQSQARRMAKYDIDQSHAVEDADEKQQEYNDAHAGDAPGAPASSSAMFAPDVDAQSQRAAALAAFAAQPPPTPDASKITVEFANAPKGMRVNSDPQSTGMIDFSVGYQMFGAGT